MLGIHGTYKEIHGGLRGYAARIMAATEESPIEAAEFMADEWHKNVAVDTGAEQASIYVQTHDGSDYAARASAARRLNPVAEIVPELAKPARKGAAAVGSAVKYSVFQELGTTRMPAHPAFYPAVAAARRQFPEITRRKLLV